MDVSLMNFELIGIEARAAARPSRTAQALLSLMGLYEQGEGIQDIEETESDRMVLLSGMVAVDTSALHGD
jgi:hypothetical protein